MIITKQGYYRLIEDYIVRSPKSVGVIPKGTMIEITQVDEIHHKVMSPQFKNWEYWDLPVCCKAVIALSKS